MIAMANLTRESFIVPSVNFDVVSIGFVIPSLYEHVGCGYRLSQDGSHLFRDDNISGLLVPRWWLAVQDRTWRHEGLRVYSVDDEIDGMDHHDLQVTLMDTDMSCMTFPGIYLCESRGRLFMKARNHLLKTS